MDKPDVFVETYIKPAAKQLADDLLDGKELDKDSIALLNAWVPDWRELYGIRKAINIIAT